MNLEMEIFQDDWIKQIGPLSLMGECCQILEKMKDGMDIHISQSSVVRMYYVEISNSDLDESSFFIEMKSICDRLIKLKVFI